MRRLGDPEGSILTVQGNLANTYDRLGPGDKALRMRQEVYSGWLRLGGEEHTETLRAANNYALSLASLQRCEEVKALMRKMIPVAKRVLGESHRITLNMRKFYAAALVIDDSSTLDDLCDAVTMYVETERTARRVLGGAHPLTKELVHHLQTARATLRARETGAP